MKTKVQRLQEYKRLKEIETVLAKDRQREHAKTAPGKKSVTPKLAEVSGDARDRAAETVGLKRGTAEKGLAVLNRAESGEPKARAAIESIDREELSVDREPRVRVYDTHEPSPMPSPAILHVLQARFHWPARILRIPKSMRL